MLERELVEEAVLLAETIAAVEASKDQRMAELVRPLDRQSLLEHCSTSSISVKSSSELHLSTSAWEPFLKQRFCFRRVAVIPERSVY